MKKITVKLTAIVLSAFIFIYGLCCSYVDIYASETNYRFIDSIWNYNDSVAENLFQYIMLVINCDLCVIDPTILSENKASILNQIGSDFTDYMNSDKGVELTEEEIPQYFEENVRIHGGGGLSFSDDIVDALHHTAQAILDEQSGYWLYPTIPIERLSPTLFTTPGSYYGFVNLIKDSNHIIYLNASNDVSFLVGTDFLPSYVNTFASFKPTDIKRITPDWKTSLSLTFGYYNDKKIELKKDDLSNINESSLTLSDSGFGYANVFTSGCCFYSSDGRGIRVWKSLDAFKLFTVGRQPYYCTPEWVNYDYSQDNSMTLTNTYLGNVVNGGVVNNYYNVVQDAIDENNTDGSLTDDQIRDIVADTIKQIQQDNNTESDSGGSGSDDNGSGGGIGAVIDGIGKFFDTLLTLVGKIIGMLSDFVNSVLTMFESFTVFTDGFSGFLTGAFGFIPQEAINVIVTGITLLVILAIIKFLK